MTFEFDHLFIFTEINAESAEQLISLGFVEGSSNTHPGQGTANRRFFFKNAMLELLWVHNKSEVTSEPIARTHLWERWAKRGAGACPVGICLRSTPGTKPSAGEVAKGTVAFPYWDYKPPYLPETMSIAVGSNSAVISEPMLFQTPFGKRPDQFTAAKLQPLEHAIGVQEITRVTLAGPIDAPLSSALQAVVDTGQLQLRPGPTYCVDIGFDGETQGQQTDLRPGLPLVVHW